MFISTFGRLKKSFPESWAEAFGYQEKGIVKFGLTLRYGEPSVDVFVAVHLFRTVFSDRFV